MRSFVGIDTGVLDQNFAGGNLISGLNVGRYRSGELGSIDARVDVTGARCFQLLESFNWSQTRNYFLGDISRRFAKIFGKLECQRQSVFAKLNFGRLFNYDFWQIEAVAAAHKVAHALRKPAFQMAIHGFSKLLKKRAILTKSARHIEV